MGDKKKRVGGTKGGEGLSEDFVNQLRQLLMGQSGQVGAGNVPGAGAMQQGQGAADIYGSVLGQGAGNIGGALQQLLQRTQDRDVMKLKEAGRASGGAQFGTPGQYAEGVYRGEAAPNIMEAIGKLQMGAAKDIFGLINDVYKNETPQAKMETQPGVFSSIMKGIGAIAPFAAKFLMPGLGVAGELAGSFPGADTFTDIGKTIGSLEPV
jgi:hypothetical protein